MFNIKESISVLISTTNGPVIGGVTKDWVTYIRGDGPIIIVASHDGVNDTGNEIPNRPNGGCCNSVSRTCTWSMTCPTGTLRDNTNCKVTISRDTYTKKIAECLQTNAIFQLPGSTRVYHPHLIYSNVDRKRIDMNREKAGGCLGDVKCEATWDAFHGYIQNAIGFVRSNCSFGILLDIHGHNESNYTNLGYNIGEQQQANDSIINSQQHSTVEGLASRNNVSIADIVNGPDSLGELLLDQRSDWRVTPSETFPHPFDEVGSAYFQGDYVVDTYGSAEGLWGNQVDSVQIEIPRWLRFNTAERDFFCEDLSDAITEWIQHWHSSRIGNCRL